MMLSSPTVLPVIALLISASFWGLVWYPARLLEAHAMFGPWQALSSFASALLVLLLVSGAAWRGCAQQPLSVVSLMLAAGWANVAFLLAVIEGEVVRVMMLFYLAPLWSALLGHWLLGERLRWVTAMMLLPGLGGAAIMLWEDQLFSQPLGRADLLAFSSGIAFASMNVMTRRLQTLGTVAKTQLAWAGVLLVASLWILVAQSPLPQAPLLAWGGAALLGVFGFMLATLCVVYAVSRMPVQRSSVIMLFEILVGALSAWWLAGEVVEPREWIGGAMIILAGLVAVFFQSEPRQAEAPGSASRGGM